MNLCATYSIKPCDISIACVSLCVFFYVMQKDAEETEKTQKKNKGIIHLLIFS